MLDDINISNKLDLERAFADDFSSPIFPILGELYLKNKDFQRAEKVCRIGQLTAYKHYSFWQCMDTKRDRDKLKNLLKIKKAPWLR